MRQALSPAEVRASLEGGADCPMLDAPTQDSFRAALRAANAFSLNVGGFLGGRSPAEQAAWLRRSLSASQFLLQPWTLEVLYAVACAGTARFTALQEILGLSSRTLAARLQALQAAGLLERRVLDARPVRTEYRLTKPGRTTAALAAPLFAHLGMAAAAAPTAPFKPAAGAQA